MAKKKESIEGEGAEVVQVVPKAGKVDLTKRVKVEFNGSAPYHKDGEVSKMSPQVAAKVEANGWGRIVGMFLLVAMFAFGANAQTVVATTMKSVYNAASDTVTNTETAYLQGSIIGYKHNASFQVVITKISGTVAGTLTLQGSIDGTNFKAMTVAEASTAINTATATDVASQTFLWRLNSNPYKYYRISWTGSGTMAAKFTAILIAM